MVKVLESSAEFRDLISKENPTVIEFFATWCGPCKMLAPMLEKFALEFPLVNFAKVDADHLADVTAEMGVERMPTSLIFRAGQKLGQFVGANPAALKAAIQSEMPV